MYIYIHTSHAHDTQVSSDTYDAKMWPYPMREDGGTDHIGLDDPVFTISKMLEKDAKARCERTGRIGVTGQPEVVE